MSRSRRTRGVFVKSIFSKSRSEDKLNRIQIESVCDPILDPNLEQQNYHLSGNTKQTTGGGREHLFGVSHPSDSTEFASIVRLIGTQKNQLHEN